MTLAALVSGLLLPELSALSQEPPPPPVAPVNDNFADATEIFGSPGTLTGDNSGATLEAFELDTNNVATLDGVLVGGTVWYKWTAPESGDFQFDTSGSIVPMALGVAQEDPLTTVKWVTNNSSFVSPIQSSLNVTVASNEVYYVALGGTQFVPVITSVTNDGTNIVFTTNMVVIAGTYQLNWRRTSGYPTLGDFSFSSDVYSVSDLDDGSYPHVWMEPTRLPTATIVRKGGSSGVVHIRYNVTNDWYYNRVTLNVFGTNITTADGSNTLVAGYTNYVRVIDQEHMVHGQRVRGQRPTVTGTFTNFVGGTLEFGDLVPPFTIVTDELTYTNNDQIYTVFSYAPPPLEEAVPSAEPFIDYFPVIGGEVIFSNYQMSAGIEVPVEARYSFLEPLVNPLIKVEIVSIEADPLESFELAPPTVSQVSSLINVHRSLVLPAMGIPGTNVFNFERSNERIKEGSKGVGYARVHVMRVTVDPSASTTVNYRIDYSYPYERYNNFFTVFSRIGVCDPGESHDKVWTCQ